MDTMCSTVRYFYRCGHSEETTYKCSRCPDDKPSCRKATACHAHIDEACHDCSFPGWVCRGPSIFDLAPPTPDEVDPEPTLVQRGELVRVVPLRPSRVLNQQEPPNQQPARLAMQQLRRARILSSLEAARVNLEQTVAVIQRRGILLGHPNAVGPTSGLGRVDA